MLALATALQKFGLDSTEDLTFGVICMMLLDFLYLFIASALLGMVFGLVTAYCLRAFHFHHVSQARHACCCCPCCQTACLAACSRQGRAQPSVLPGGASKHHGLSQLWRSPLLALSLPRFFLLQEVALIGMTAYLSYLAGDVFGFSGILSLFVCAVAISHYALHNISRGCGGAAGWR